MASSSPSDSCQCTTRPYKPLTLSSLRAGSLSAVWLHASQDDEVPEARSTCQQRMSHTKHPLPPESTPRVDPRHDWEYSSPCTGSATRQDTCYSTQPPRIRAPRVPLDFVHRAQPCPASVPPTLLGASFPSLTHHRSTSKPLSATTPCWTVQHFSGVTTPILKLVCLNGTVLATTHPDCPILLDARPKQCRLTDTHTIRLTRLHVQSSRHQHDLSDVCQLPGFSSKRFQPPRLPCSRLCFIRLITTVLPLPLRPIAPQCRQVRILRLPVLLGIPIPDSFMHARNPKHVPEGRIPVGCRCGRHAWGYSRGGGGAANGGIPLGGGRRTGVDSRDIDGSCRRGPIDTCSSGSSHRGSRCRWGAGTTGIVTIGIVNAGIMIIGAVATSAVGGCVDHVSSGSGNGEDRPLRAAPGASAGTHPPWPHRPAVSRRISSSSTAAPAAMRRTRITAAAGKQKQQQQPQRTGGPRAGDCGTHARAHMCMAHACGWSGGCGSGGRQEGAHMTCFRDSMTVWSPAM